MQTRTTTLVELAKWVRAIGLEFLIHGDSNNFSWQNESVQMMLDYAGLHHVHLAHCALERPIETTRRPSSRKESVITTLNVQSVGCRCSPGTVHEDTAHHKRQSNATREMNELIHMEFMDGFLPWVHCSTC